MDNELQRILNEFDNLFKRYKNIDNKENIILSDFDEPVENILKDEKLRELLFKLDEYIINQRGVN